MLPSDIVPNTPMSQGGSVAETQDTAQDTGSERSFEEEQRAAAQAQGLTAENAVPEQRPQAFLTDDGPPHSELTERLKQAGELSDEPMGKEAYDRASSKAQAKKAADSSQQEAAHVGSIVEITGPKDSPHVGRKLALVRVITHADVKGTLLKAAGSPDQLYSQPKDVELKAIAGDDRDGEVVVLDLTEYEYKKINDATFHGRRTR